MKVAKNYKKRNITSGAIGYIETPPSPKKLEEHFEDGKLEGEALGESAKEVIGGLNFTCIFWICS